MGDLFYQLGTIFGGLGARVGQGSQGSQGGRGGAVGREVAIYDPGSGDVFDVGDADHGGDDDGSAGESALIGGAVAWLVARLLRPRPVSWPRVVLAGAAAAALADLVGRSMEERPEPGRLPFADDPQELLGRLGAGVAVAAGYATLLYPRLPGSPLVRGLTFGALEIAAAPRGGLVALARATSGIRFPLQALALPVDEDAGPLSHLAFGLGLGLFYRYAPARAEDEEDA